MYNIITNPETGRQVSIYGKRGQMVLRKYLTIIQQTVGGGDSDDPKDIQITYFTQSLKNEERMKIIQKNKLIIPEMKIFKSINGYDEDITIKKLINMKLKYFKLDFETYGTLANFLTKVKAFQYQIKHKIKYMCLIEDDLILEEGFREFITDKLPLLKKSNMLRLAKWGEGYVTSLKGAKNIVRHIYEKGIIRNIDNQLRIHCGKEIRIWDTPWKLVIQTNKGDCLKTNKISINDRTKLPPAKKTAKKSPAKKPEKSSCKKPRGRPRKNKRWDCDKGQWVDL